ncbi:MAG: hypothetical protein ACPIOQ_62870, partial [Promethearchaeia archaeon]
MVALGKESTEELVLTREQFDGTVADHHCALRKITIQGLLQQLEIVAFHHRVFLVSPALSSLLGFCDFFHSMQIFIV